MWPLSATFGKNGRLFIPTSGHTAYEEPLRRSSTATKGLLQQLEQ